MGGELDVVSTTALKDTARRSAPAQPTIMQIVRFLRETPMFRCAEAAHKKTSKTLALMCLEITNGVLIPALDFASAVKW